MSETRAHIQPDYTRFSGIAIYLTKRGPNDTTDVMLPVNPTWCTYQAHEAAELSQQPSLRLPDDMARALLDALSAHYGGTTDVRTLRKDYDAERSRVDRLLDAAIKRGAL